MTGQVDTCLVDMGRRRCGLRTVNGRCPLHSNPYDDSRCRYCAEGVKHTYTDHLDELAQQAQPQA